ncbi:MAG: NifU family protein [Chitinophagales bacterium]|nr:NifU family protein [Chitinophagales bacterium]
MEQSLLSRVEQSLDTIRPHLRSDGGDIEIVGITDDYILQVRWLGACLSCPMSFMTMRAGIEQAVRMAVPEIVAVEAVSESPIY